MTGRPPIAVAAPSRDVRPAVAAGHQCGARARVRVSPGRAGLREVLCTLERGHDLDGLPHGAGEPVGRHGREQRIGFVWPSA